MSRTPLREGLLSLEREGFVRVQMDKGFSVGPLSGREVREAYPILSTLEELALRASTPVVYSLVEHSRESTITLPWLQNPRRPLNATRNGTKY